MTSHFTFFIFHFTLTFSRRICGVILSYIYYVYIEYGKLKTRKSHRWLAIMLVIMFICGGFLYYTQYAINPMLASYAEFKSKLLFDKAVSASVLIVISTDTVLYNDLVLITKNEKNEINLVQANTVQINILGYKICQTTLSESSYFETDGIGVPLGAFTGINFLKSAGKEVNLRAAFVGPVNYDIDTEFKVENIGYTNHKIYMTIHSFVLVNLIVSKVKVEVSSKFLLCESIIMGRIPQYLIDAEG